MLFDSSIRKELARSFGATLVVLVTVVMTMMLIRTLGQAARGNVNPSDVMLVMGFTVLGQLPTILSLSLFIAIVGTLSRMYRDSEMVIWFASGRGLISLVRPLLRFAWPVMVVIAVLSLLVWPWANSQIQELKTRYEQRSDIMDAQTVDDVVIDMRHETVNAMVADCCPQGSYPEQWNVDALKERAAAMLGVDVDIHSWLQEDQIDPELVVRIHLGGELGRPIISDNGDPVRNLVG